MKYVVCYLLPDEAAEYHIGVVKDVSKKFNLRPLHEYIDPHLTLKSPFEAENIEDVESAISDFAKIEEPAPLALQGFGHFKNKVVYMDVNASEQARKISENLVRALKLNVPWISFDKHDFQKKLHATVARCKDMEKFNEVWEYLNEKYSPDFEMSLDNISILKHDGRRWHNYSRFELNKELSELSR